MNSCAKITNTCVNCSHVINVKKLIFKKHTVSKLAGDVDLGRGPSPCPLKATLDPRRLQLKDEMFLAQPPLPPRLGTLTHAKVHHREPDQSERRDIWPISTQGYLTNQHAEISDQSAHRDIWPIRVQRCPLNQVAKKSDQSAHRDIWPISMQRYPLNQVAKKSDLSGHRYIWPISMQRYPLN